eukprot:TRINITY_DN1753_c0_g1_i12.p2 TRINITY_DN1753_c0_g1~~TRINITY_DN1753_c0_g1_i12.p2  ORF type:complete len:119 (-),score=28.08 TRINITY_DN1753_c0_g1_i12:1453-1809(-)
MEFTEISELEYFIGQTRPKAFNMFSYSFRYNNLQRLTANIHTPFSPKDSILSHYILEAFVARREKPKAENNADDSLLSFFDSDESEIDDEENVNVNVCLEAILGSNLFCRMLQNRMEH